MKDHVRAVIAAIAIAHVTKRSVSSVYDYGASKYRSIDAKVQGSSVSAYDYDAGCSVDGSLPSLYHYGDSHYVDLTISGQSFSGYDYGSSSHFEGTVSGSEAQIYDYGKSGYHTYST